CDPSHASAPMNPQSARKPLPGSMTQNSLPSGSARTTCGSSGPCPMSRWLPPRSSALATVRRWSSGEVLVRSKCIRFWPVFFSSPGRNRSRNPVSSAGSSVTPSGAASQPRTPAQNLARRRGSWASKQSARSRDVIGSPIGEAAGVTLTSPAGAAPTISAMAGHQRLPPGPVLAIPGHRLRQAGGEVLGRAVAQLGGELAVVQRVAGVVTLAVLDVPDHVPALSARLQQQPGQLLVGQLPAAADVVDL